MLFTVMVQVDNGGSALILCKEIVQDPLLPNNVVLLDVVALDWPIKDKFLNVQNWSVMKSTVLNYMMGELKLAPTLTTDLLTGKEVTVPYPPKSLPSQVLVSPDREHEMCVTDED